MVFWWVSNITPNLVELNLQGNLLKGSTPSHFGMVMNSLRHINFSYNKGRYLKSFTYMSLNMAETFFSKDLPSIFMELQRLVDGRNSIGIISGIETSV